jgi:hypothetical protein
VELLNGKRLHRPEARVVSAIAAADADRRRYIRPGKPRWIELHIAAGCVMFLGMADLIVGKSYSIAQITAAYHADAPSGGEEDPFFILHRGDELIALCLQHKLNPELGEVWIGEAPAAALWGERLAQCKGKKTVPLYYCPRNRSFYEFKGHHLVTGDTTEPAELTRRKSPAPLSRIVFLKKA